MQYEGICALHEVEVKCSIFHEISNIDNISNFQIISSFPLLIFHTLGGFHVYLFKLK